MSARQDPLLTFFDWSLERSEPVFHGAGATAALLLRWLGAGVAALLVLVFRPVAGS